MIKSVEPKLSKNNQMPGLYRDFIHQCEVLDHIEKVKEDILCSNCYYQSYQGVHRPDKVTTELREIFNTSSVTMSGKFFNDLFLKEGIY